MSYEISGKDIVIKGFDLGINEDPYKGIADMRNVEIRTVPGEASVTYRQQAVVLPPVINAMAYTAQDSGDTLTVSSTAGLYVGCAIFLDNNTAGGLSDGVVYYVFNITATTFQLTLSPIFNSAVVISSDGTGDFTTYQYGGSTLTTVSPSSYWVDRSDATLGRNATYVVDQRNRVWMYLPVALGTRAANTLYFMGNISGTGIDVSPDNGIVIWKGYLILFRASLIDIANLNTLLNTGPAAAWDYDWQSSSSSSFNNRISVLVAQDDAVYFTTQTGVGSLLENPNETFDPTDANSYTLNQSALAIPSIDRSTCLAELGTNLLVGGRLSMVYPWDRISPSYNYPLIVPDILTVRIVGTNQNAYIFSGRRGYIYITNGSSIELWKKIPDYLTGVINPYIEWGDASFNRNQLYFSFSARNNGNTLQTTVNGAWAIDLEKDALRMVNKTLNTGYAGYSSMVVEAPMGTSQGTNNPPGTSVMIGWYTTTGTLAQGIGVGSVNPYIDYESFIETEMIPVGTFLKPFSPSQIEWKTSRPLVSGEGIKISYRANINDSYTLIGESLTAGALSDLYKANFQKVQWVQFKIEMKSTDTTPSFVRLTEIRIRDWPSA